MILEEKKEYYGLAMGVLQDPRIDKGVDALVEVLRPTLQRDPFAALVYSAGLAALLAQAALWGIAVGQYRNPDDVFYNQDEHDQIVADAQAQGISAESFLANVAVKALLGASADDD